MNSSRKPRQLEFFGKLSLEHGGDSHRGKRKIARPIATKRPMFLTLRAGRARGIWSMLQKRNKSAVARIVAEESVRCRVKIYKFENVGNHLHLLVQARNRRDFQNFLRVLPQKIMFAVTGARKGLAKGKFWDALAHTRIVEWGRHFLNIRRYLAQNKLEALGLKREALQSSFVHYFASD